VTSRFFPAQKIKLGELANFVDVIRRLVFIIALAVCVGTASARDERSIKDLGKALVALAPDVDPGEAELLSMTAHTTSRSLAREYRIVLNPEFQNFLINIGLRQRGYCAHFARDIGTRLKTLKLKTLVLHWGAAFAGTSGEDNCLVVTARNQPFQDGIILDGWRRAGRLFWCAVREDHEYEVEQHYGHSGITAWKENVHETAWLQDYRPSERKPKRTAAPR
jgi:hypothetical protein